MIVVGQVGKTTREEATHLRDQLRELDAPTLGVVANRVRRRRGYYGDYAYPNTDGARGAMSRLTRRV